MRIEREWAMPNKNTFDIPPIKRLLEEEVSLDAGIWLDPFANKNRLATYTNDINSRYDTDYVMDALVFLQQFKQGSVFGVLYDPPYSPRQVAEHYKAVGRVVNMQTTQATFWTRQKQAISKIVKSGGKVISFGWNSGGIGQKYGFRIKRILLVPHGSNHNDTICTVEVKE